MRRIDCQQYSRKDTTFVNTDCLTALKALPDKSVALVVTDPPYGGHTHNQQTWCEFPAPSVFTHIHSHSLVFTHIPGVYLNISADTTSLLTLNHV